MNKDFLNFSPSDDDTLQLIDENRSTLSHLITQQYFDKHPPINAAQKLRLSQLCQEDIAHHLDFLKNALHLGKGQLFIDYIIWLKSVLNGRNLDTTDTVEALHQMMIFFQQLLKKSEQIKSQGIIEHAIKLLKTAPTIPASYISTDIEVHKNCPSYAQALVSNNRQKSGQIIQQAIIDGTSYGDICTEIIQPSMYEVGRLWQINQLSVAEEHLATVTSQNLLSSMYTQMDFKETNHRKALFACIEDNHHALGLRMISDVFELQGWTVDYLGENTPTHSLIQMIDKQSIDLLGLSISMFDQLNLLKQTIAKLKSELGSACPDIAIGGFPLNNFPELVNSMKAEIWFSNATIAAKEAK
ncbi:MAG: cobalamin-dependent protein [Gammaproteobacteria bacterium]|nr:cobalamin-dependent protein [Gammaproteobacteria bacterium]